MRIAALTLCWLAVSTPAFAQDNPLAKADLPRGVAARLTEIIDNAATRKITGDATISDTITGDVAAMKGHFVVRGKINGELVVIDGTVDFALGSVVTGDVTIVNGSANTLELATIDGTVTMYDEGFSPFEVTSESIP